MGTIFSIGINMHSHLGFYSFSCLTCWICVVKNKLNCCQCAPELDPFPALGQGHCTSARAHMQRPRLRHWNKSWPGHRAGVMVSAGYFRRLKESLSLCRSGVCKLSTCCADKSVHRCCSRSSHSLVSTNWDTENAILLQGNSTKKTLLLFATVLRGNSKH